MTVNIGKILDLARIVEDDESIAETFIRFSIPTIFSLSLTLKVLT